MKLIYQETNCSQLDHSSIYEMMPDDGEVKEFLQIIKDTKFDEAFTVAGHSYENVKDYLDCNGERINEGCYAEVNVNDGMCEVIEYELQEREG